MASPDWAPTPDQVAALLHARTRGRGSIAAASATEQGSFTATTRPTLDQVEVLIELASGDFAGMLAGHEPCNSALYAATATAVGYRTAQLIEASYYPERTNGQATAFAAFGQLWQESSAIAAAAIKAGCPIR